MVHLSLLSVYNFIQRGLVRGLAEKTAKSKSKSKSMAFKSKLKSSKSGLKSGLKSKSGLKYYKFGLWTPKCDYSSSRPPKGTSLRKSASFKLSTVKIRWGVWPVGELTESVMDTHTDTSKFIFCQCVALDRQLFILMTSSTFCCA